MACARFSCFVWVALLVFACPAILAEEIDDQLSQAKYKRQIALTAAGLHLRFAFDDAIEKAAAKGDLNGVKKLQVEQEAFKKEGKLPTSAEMKTGLAEYYKERRASASVMHTAYRRAISEYTKAQKFDLAKEIEADMKRFVAAETLLLGPIGGGNGVATLPPGADQTIPSIIKTFTDDIKKAVKEGTSVNRKEAVRDAVQNADKALQRGAVEFHFKIRDVSEDGGKFTLSVNPFIGSSDIPAVVEHTSAIHGVLLTAAQAKNIRPGNMLVIRGTARLAQGFDSRADGLCAVKFLPEREHYGTIYGVFITKYKISIRTDDNEIEEQ